MGIDALFDRQTVFDFKDGCNQPQVAQFVAKELVRKFGRKIGKVVFSCVPASSQERNETRNKAFSALVSMQRSWRESEHMLPMASSSERLHIDMYQLIDDDMEQRKFSRAATAAFTGHRFVDASLREHVKKRLTA